MARLQRQCGAGIRKAEAQLGLVNDANNKRQGFFRYSMSKTKGKRFLILVVQRIWLNTDMKVSKAWLWEFFPGVLSEWATCIFFSFKNHNAYISALPLCCSIMHLCPYYVCTGKHKVGSILCTVDHVIREGRGRSLEWSNWQHSKQLPYFLSHKESSGRLFFFY